MHSEARSPLDNSLSLSLWDNYYRLFTPTSLCPFCVGQIMGKERRWKE